MTESQTTQRIAEILNRIAKLPSANLEPPQFFANFLQLAVAASGSRGGAIWVIQPEQAPQCYCHVDLDQCQVSNPEQQQVIVEAIMRSVKETKSLVLPPGGSDAGDESSKSNLCPYPLFFKPLKAANQVAMVLQTIGSDGVTAHDYRSMVGLLDQVGEAAETYLAHRRAAVLDDDRKSLARLLKFTEGIHDSLEPEKVIYQIANIGRETIGCDRLTVWIDPRVKRGLRAVSGIDKPDRRAILMQAIEKLSQHCLEIKKPIMAAREQLPEMQHEEKLTQLVKDYFNVSQLDHIYLQPMKQEDVYYGVIVAEGFDDKTTTNLSGVTSSVAAHGALALKNALEMASVPIVKPFAKFRKMKADPQKRRKWLIWTTVFLVALVVLLLTPWPVKIECACEMTPEKIRTIQSPLEQIQINEILKKSGETVRQGDVIARLDTLELETQLESLKQQLRQQDIILNDPAASPAKKKQSEYEMAILENKLNFVNAQIKKCDIVSPIDGTILTQDLKRMEGMTVSLGDTICEVASLNNWQLVLDVPQQEIDWVQKALRESHTGSATVDFYLSAYPQYKLHARIDEFSQISQTSKTREEEGNVFSVRIDLNDEQLQPVSEGLRDGMVGRAKIGSLEKPLWYVLMRKAIRFFRVTFF